MRAAIPLSPKERAECPFTPQDRVWLLSHGVFTRYLAHEIGDPLERDTDEEADR